MKANINPQQIIQECKRNGEVMFSVPSPTYFSDDLIETELVLRDFRDAGIPVIDRSSGIVLTDDSGEPTRNLVRQLVIIVAGYVERRAAAAKAVGVI